VAPEVSGLQSGGTALGRYLALMALAGAPLVFLAKDPYWLNIIAFTYLMGGLAASWNIIGGFGGQFSLGHGVFFGIGAYVTAIATSRYGLSPWLVMVPAAVLAALVAMLISWPTFRLRGPFFAIATMAFNEVCTVLLSCILGTHHSMQLHSQHSALTNFHPTGQQHPRDSPFSPVQEQSRVSCYRQ
jgi:branched-chain amino acid transport system permease protein